MFRPQDEVVALREKDLEGWRSPTKEEKWQTDTCQAAARFVRLFPAECEGQLPNNILALEFAVWELCPWALPLATLQNSGNSFKALRYCSFYKEISILISSLYNKPNPSRWIPFPFSNTGCGEDKIDLILPVIGMSSSHVRLSFYITYEAWFLLLKWEYCARYHSGEADWGFSSYSHNMTW